MASASPDAAFIIDIDGGGMFKFQLMPRSINDSDAAQYTEYDILGRSTPLRGYVKGGPRSLEFAAQLFYDPIADGPGRSKGAIKKDIDFLRSLVRPDYAGGLRPPHRCLIVIGANIQMIGVLDSVNVQYASDTTVWDPGPGLAHGAVVALKFSEVKDIPLDTYDVRGGAF